MMVGAAFSMNFSMRAGPKGAAPPDTDTTLDRNWGFTIGLVVSHEIRGGTRGSHVGCKRTIICL